MVLTGAIKAKAGNGKGFMIEGQEGWFNAVDISLLTKFNKGDKVTITYEVKGLNKNVSSIIAEQIVTQPTQAQPQVTTPGSTTTPTGPVCSDCGKALKNDKYTKCYDCNQKNPVKKQWSGSAKKSNYDSPERTAQIQRGNALNAAASTVMGRQEDPETLAEMTLVVADKFLEWLRAE